MLSRAHRFHGPNSLNNVYRSGKTSRGPLFATKTLLNSKRQDFRLAVVVSRKVNKSAVKRNRIRRRLYAVTRTLSPDIVEPYDIVITVFSDGVLDESEVRLVEQLRRQLSQAGILVKRVS